MERRQEHRFRADQTATLTILSKPPRVFDCRVTDISGKGMRLELSEPVPVNIPVRVDVNDWMLLGEVCYVKPGPDRVSVGLVLDQVLHETPELTPLIEALGRTTVPEAIPASRTVVPR